MEKTEKAREQKRKIMADKFMIKISLSFIKNSRDHTKYNGATWTLNAKKTNWVFDILVFEKEDQDDIIKNDRRQGSPFKFDDTLVQLWVSKKVPQFFLLFWFYFVIT